MATILENPHKSVVLSTATLTAMAFCTLYLISAVHPGAKEIGKSGKPLMFSVEAGKVSLKLRILSNFHERLVKTAQLQISSKLYLLN